VVELEVDEIGPSLKYATAKVNKASRSGAGGGGSWCGGAPASRPPRVVGQRGKRKTRGQRPASGSFAAATTSPF